VGARLAELLPLSMETRQHLLEMDHAADRLEILRRLVRPAGQ
jgi:Lon protease-like protein